MTADQTAARTALTQWFDATRKGVSSFFSLQGYAGVGKTWLTADWLAGLMRANPEFRIVVVAPTNKAVDVLRSKMRAQAPDVADKFEFRSLDSYLGYRIKRNDDWEMERSKGGQLNNGRKEREPDLVACDEASMVKLEYHTDLKMRRVPVLYICDPAQLEPVGEQASPACNVPDKVLMTEVVRQAKGNPIIDFATYMRGKVNDASSFILQDLRQFAREDDRRISFTGLSNVPRWACAAADKGLDCRILAFTNAAVSAHNAVMHRLRFPDAPLFGVGELALVNEAFEYKEPDSEEELITNGELMRVVGCERAPDIAGVEVYAVQAQRLANNMEVNGEVVPRVYDMLVPLNADKATATHKQLTNALWDARRAGNHQEADRLLDLRRPLNLLAPLRHAYSCTVHKSQGSTYDAAIVDFSDVYRSREMRARLMYVAGTRPSKFLVFAHGG